MYFGVKVQIDPSAILGSSGEGIPDHAGEPLDDADFSKLLG